MAGVPLPHQIIGAEHLRSPDNPRAGLFDDPGSGKSYTSIQAMDLEGIQRAVIVCPAAVRQVWIGEFKKFATKPRKVKAANGIHDLNLWLKRKIDVLVISYEFANNYAKHFLRHGDFYELLVIDEFHYLKNPDAARTKALLGADCRGASGMAMFAARTWCLTGTLMANDPTDAWTFLRFNGTTDMTHAQFKARYFDSAPTAYGARYGPKEGANLRVREMIAKHGLRRTKSEFWKDMPAFWVTDIRLDGDTAEIRDLIANHPDLEQQIKDAARNEGLSALDAPYIATLRRLIGEAKAVPFAQLLAQKLRDGLEKAVVMGLHTNALNILHAELTKQGFDPVILTGATNKTARKDAVDRFQGDPKCRVFIGNIKAAGTGLTLTAASDIYMLEQSWSPADNAQALMRVHRIGQTKNVTGTFVALNDSVDDIVVDILAEKTMNIASIDPTAFELLN